MKEPDTEQLNCKTRIQEFRCYETTLYCKFWTDVNSIFQSGLFQLLGVENQIIQQNTGKRSKKIWYMHLFCFFLFFHFTISKVVKFCLLAFTCIFSEYSILLINQEYNHFLDLNKFIHEYQHSLTKAVYFTTKDDIAPIESISNE